MHDAVAMQVVEGVAHFGEDALHLFFGERTHAHMLGERLAFDVFEDDAVAQAFDFDEIERLADVFVVEHRGGLIFLAQRGAAGRVGGALGLQRLDNDFFAVEFGQIDLTVAVARGVQRMEVGVVGRKVVF